MTQITSGGTTLEPILVDGYRSVRSAGNIVHTLVDNEWPAITLRPARPRTGTLNLLCAELDDALAMDTLHAAANVVTLVDSDHPGLNMTYVASGTVQLELDNETRSRWWVRVDFQEIQP